MNKYIVRMISAVLMVSIFVTIFSISGSAVSLTAAETSVKADIAEVKPVFIRVEKSVGIQFAQERQAKADAEAAAAKAEADRIAAEQEAARVAQEKAAAEEAARQAEEKKQEDAKKAATKSNSSTGTKTSTGGNGSDSSSGGDTTPPPANASIGERIVAEAKKLKGCAYVSPSQGPTTFDCSGFTKYVYKMAGAGTLSASSGAQAKSAYATGALTKDQLQPGDLVFWSNSYGRGKGNFMGIGHVGIYIGGNKVIDASSDHGEVVERTLYDNPNGSKFEFGARPY